MKSSEVERWVHEIVERLKAGQPLEDSRVELKSAWINAEKAARRIAGHANAARSDLILWVVGLDEKSGVVGAGREDLAEWWARAKEQFDGLAPDLDSYDVPVDDKTVVALLFVTDRAPFVVKNPAYSGKDGGPVQFEVPWREGTATRSARRADLLKLLVPLQALPKLEARSGAVCAHPVTGPNGNRELKWKLTLQLYVEPTSEKPVTIPFHKCTVTIEMPGLLDRTPMTNLLLGPVNSFFVMRSRISSMIVRMQDEVRVSGPGMLYMQADLVTPAFLDENHVLEVCIIASLLPANAEHAVLIEKRLPPRPPETDGTLVWGELDVNED